MENKEEKLTCKVCSECGNITFSRPATRQEMEICVMNDYFKNVDFDNLKELIIK